MNRGLYRRIWGDSPPEVKRESMDQPPSPSASPAVSSPTNGPLRGDVQDPSSFGVLGNLFAGAFQEQLQAIARVASSVEVLSSKVDRITDQIEPLVGMPDDFLRVTKDLEASLSDRIESVSRPLTDLMRQVSVLGQEIVLLRSKDQTLNEATVRVEESLTALTTMLEGVEGKVGELVKPRLKRKQAKEPDLVSWLETRLGALESKIEELDHNLFANRTKTKSVLKVLEDQQLILAQLKPQTRAPRTPKAQTTDKAPATDKEPTTTDADAG